MGSFRRYRSHSTPKVRAITVKYAGNCACCGARIEPGAIADYYPVGTIAGVTIPKIAHLNAMQGNSVSCSMEYELLVNGERLNYRWQPVTRAEALCATS